MNAFRNSPEKSAHAKHHDVALTILSKTFESAAEETVTHLGGKLLGQVVSGAIAASGAAVLATVAKSLVSSLFDKTSAIERKLDVVISEPFETAVTTLSEVLSVQATNADDLREFNKQLDAAFEDLRKAYTYARKLSPDKLILIRMYQCLVAALKQGGGQFLNLYLRDLKALALAARERGKQAEAEAGLLQPRFDELDFEMIGQRIMEEGAAGALIGMASANQGIERRKSGLLEESRTLKQYADEVDSFCQFVLKLAENRIGILKASKISSGQ